VREKYPATGTFAEHQEGRALAIAAAEEAVEGKAKEGKAVEGKRFFLSSE
jgi:hypothetical protein